MDLGMEKRGVGVLVVIFGLVQISIAAVYTVGDSTGWTTIGNFDYKQWAATKTFQVGDIILFKYNTQFHNVMQVTHAEYRSCNATAPIATHTTGNDSITITARGHHFFLCGVPGHCQSGQKVDIAVPRLSSAALSPSSALPSSPPIASARVPAPSSSEAALLYSTLSRFLGKLGLAMAVIAAFVM